MEKEQKAWFASDHHFGHDFMRKLRNFETIEEHDEAIINAHNAVVSKGDIVFFLGDFVFRSARHYEYYTQRLNGNLHLIRGNHDTIGLEGKTRGFAWVKDYYEIHFPNPFIETPNKTLFVMSHYPLYCWHKNSKGSIMLHGHTHNGISDNEIERGKITDVEINHKNGLAPYELRDMFLLMKDRKIFAPDCNIR